MYRWPSGKFNNSSPENLGSRTHCAHAHTLHNIAHATVVGSTSIFAKAVQCNHIAHFSFALPVGWYVLNGNCYLKICFKSFNLFISLRRVTSCVTALGRTTPPDRKAIGNGRRSAQTVNCNSFYGNRRRENSHRKSSGPGRRDHRNHSWIFFTFSVISNGIVGNDWKYGKLKISAQFYCKSTKCEDGEVGADPLNGFNWWQ